MMTLLGGALFGQASSKTSIYRPLSIFTEVFDLVRSNYVEAVTSALASESDKAVLDSFRIGGRTARILTV